MTGRPLSGGAVVAKPDEITKALRDGLARLGITPKPRPRLCESLIYTQEGLEPFQLGGSRLSRLQGLRRHGIRLTAEQAELLDETERNA